ncbi:MAG: winged helix DNA-binding domain-containing protein [Propionibacteriaceae bacterium]|nr:winged helix DNA-binding domain-containing protein [Propionibacteriaceae bacterium]
MSIEGQRLAYLVMNAELEARICSGPIRGAQHTYAVLDEWVAPSRPRSAEDALAELTLRFFEGHGPATLADFTRWSSLRTTQARAGLESVRHRLESLDCLDQTLWCTPSATEPPSHPEVALLVPLYDEVTLSYPEINFEVAAGHPHQPGMDLFIGSVIIEETNVGTWRRTVRGRKVIIETHLTPLLSSSQRSAVADAVVRLADFLGLELETAG